MNQADRVSPHFCPCVPQDTGQGLFPLLTQFMVKGSGGPLWQGWEDMGSLPGAHPFQAAVWRVSAASASLEGSLGVLAGIRSLWAAAGERLQRGGHSVLHVAFIGHW